MKVAHLLNNLFDSAGLNNVAVGAEPSGQVPCKNGNIFYKSKQYNSKNANVRLML